MFDILRFFEPTCGPLSIYLLSIKHVIIALGLASSKEENLPRDAFSRTSTISPNEKWGSKKMSENIKKRRRKLRKSPWILQANFFLVYFFPFSRSVVPRIFWTNNVCFSSSFLNVYFCSPMENNFDTYFMSEIFARSCFDVRRHNTRLLQLMCRTVKVFLPTSLPLE